MSFEIMVIRSGPLEPCLRAILAIIALSTVEGCRHDVPTCFGVEPGDHIEATIVDAYVYGSTDYIFVGSAYNNACEFGFDFEQGDVLDLTVTGTATVDDVCSVGFISVASSGSLTWIPVHSPASNSPAIFVGDFTESTGTCSGPSDLLFEVTGKDPFAPATKGQIPSVVLTRNFQGGTDAGDCPARCFGEFVVNLKRTNG